MRAPASIPGQPPTAEAAPRGSSATGTAGLAAALLVSILATIAATMARGAESPPVSIAQLRVQLPLAPLVEHLEARIPRRLNHWDEWRRWHGLEIRYRIERGPLQVWMFGDVLHVATRVAYRVRARKRVLGRFNLSAGCGVDEPPRLVDVHLAGRLDWRPDWRLIAHTRVFPNRFLNPCRVGPLDTDATPLIDHFLRRELIRTARGGIDEQIPRLIDLRPLAARVWAHLWRPLRLEDAFWLELRPGAIAASPPLGQRDRAELLLQLTLQPRIGSEPPQDPDPLPLPPLRPLAPRPPGFHLRIAVSLDPARVDRRLAERVQGRTLGFGGQALPIDSIRVLAEDGTIRVRLTLGGGIPLELTGQLDYDPETRVLGLVAPEPHLALDHPLAGLFDKVATQPLRALMADRIQWPLGPRIAAMRDELEQTLNRPVGPDARLRTRIHSLEPSDFSLRDGRIEFDIRVEGDMDIQLVRDPDPAPHRPLPAPG